MRQRRDWHVGRLHVIRRGYNDAQFGVIVWGWDNAQLRRVPTLDIWFWRTLWTFRWWGKNA